MNKVFQFSDLKNSDLIIDATYMGGKKGNAGDDPISKILNCGNQGGFRYLGKFTEPKFCVLYSEMASNEWPDELDYQNGTFTYYGDNKKPGHDIHDTNKKGNEILRVSFENLHTDRAKLCPFFIFTKAEKTGRSVIFRGLAVPGAINLNKSEDLIGVWKKSTERFLNYKAIFTILDISTISRNWLNDLSLGITNSKHEPIEFSQWKKTGVYKPLIVEEANLVKNKTEQLPQNKFEEIIIERIINFYKKEHPDKDYGFEKCAVELAKMIPGTVTCNRTRPWKDGGRDALGVFRIGSNNTYIDVEFALEAKCHQLKTGSSVKETSRLISRIKYRQFGIFITTSYLAKQAYEEIIEDQHPILIFSATNIANTVIKKLDLNDANPTESLAKLNNWLVSIK